MSLPAEVQILPNIKSCLRYTRVQHLRGVPNWHEDIEVEKV